MCCCEKPNVNGQLGYRWNNPNESAGIYPVNPPELSDGETLVRDEPGRCGGLDSHSHHYRLVSASMGRFYLLVRHGGGDDRVSLYKPEAEALKALDSTACYWVMNAIMHANGDGRREARQTTEATWRKAAAEKRIKTRKVRNSTGVKVWIETAAA
jgi:hypothetical protein